MLNRKISDYTDGGAIQATDYVEVLRSGDNFKILGSEFDGSLPDEWTVGDLGELTIQPADSAELSVGLTLKTPDETDGFNAIEVRTAAGVLVARLEGGASPHFKLFSSIDANQRSDMDAGRLQLISDTDLTELDIGVADAQSFPAINVATQVGVVLFRVGGLGEVIAPALPTADPVVDGALWVDTAAGFVVKQSQG